MAFSFLEILFRNFNTYHSRSAFYIDGKSYSYADLLKEVIHTQQLLKEAIQEDEKLIGIMISDDLETYASIFACWFLGLAVVPLSSRNPLERNKYIIDHAGLKTLILSGSFPGSAIPSGLLLNIVNTGKEIKDNAELVFIPEDDESLQYLLYTSGSTGFPKGVPIKRGNLYAFLKYFAALYPDLDHTERFLQIYDLSFDGAFPAYLLPLMLGATIYTVPHDQIKYLYAFKLIKEHKLTVLKMPPSTLAYLRPYFRSISQEQVKYCLFGGEALNANLMKEWQKCVPNARIHNVYGPTECTIISTVYDWSDPIYGGKERNGIVSIGKPVGLNTIEICDSDLQPLPSGETGEICISGPQVSSGYWKDHQRTGMSFFDLVSGREKQRFYKTGDLAAMDQEGYLMFRGRVDNQVQIQGYRVELEEIERHARELYPDRNVVAVAAAVDGAVNEVALFVEGESIEIMDMERYLEGKLPFYMLPSKILCMAEFPKTAGGKIDRKILSSTLNPDQNDR